METSSRLSYILEKSVTLKRYGGLKISMANPRTG